MSKKAILFMVPVVRTKPLPQVTAAGTMTQHSLSLVKTNQSR